MKNILTQYISVPSNAGVINVTFSGEQAGAPGEDVLTSLSQGVIDYLNSAGYKVAAGGSISISILPAVVSPPMPPLEEETE